MPEVITIAVALFLSWLFAWAAIHKLRSIEEYRYLLMAWFAPWQPKRLHVYAIGCLELAIGMALLLPQTRDAGLLAAAMALLLYTASMGLQLGKGASSVRCGCSGVHSEVVIRPVLLLRNLVCTAFALSALLPDVSMSVVGIQGVVLALAAALFLTLAYLVGEQLIVNAQRFGGEK